MKTLKTVRFTLLLLARLLMVMIAVMAVPVMSMAAQAMAMVAVGGVTSVVNGSTIQMIATVLPADAADKTVTWSVTSGTGTATIDATSGLLTGVTVGTVTVTATANDVSGISGSEIITVDSAGTTTAGRGGAVSHIPAVQTEDGTVVTASSVVLNGDITSDDGYDITGYGFLWGASSNSLTNQLDQGADNHSGVFTASLSNLAAGATYYFEAYATSSYGTADGAVMSFTTTGAVPTLVPIQVFSDVPASFWASDAIDNLSSIGYVSGYPGGVFNPGNQITRAEFATIMDKVLKLTRYTAQAPMFSDVDTGDWFARAVETAVSTGIFKGYGDSTFHPNAPISRQEIACVLVQALGKSQLADSDAKIKTEFLDDQDIAWWSRGYITVALQQGIAGGYPGGSFKPEDETTRAEACTMVENFLSVYK
jgi:hypothetical protein